MGRASGAVPSAAASLPPPLPLAPPQIHRAYEQTVDTIVAMVERKKAEISDSS